MVVVIDVEGSAGTFYRWISAGLLIQWAVVELNLAAGKFLAMVVETRPFYYFFLDRNSKNDILLSDKSIYDKIRRIMNFW